MTEPGSSVAVFYLARGAEVDCFERFSRFLASYIEKPALAEHRLVVIFKGFPDAAALARAKTLFAQVEYTSVETDDDNFDIGAYHSACTLIDSETVCFLNSNCQILSEGWLAKLLANFRQESVGLVGATGSFESLNGRDARFPPFPNPHVRSNVFVLSREHALQLLPSRVPDKTFAYLAESGTDSLTLKMQALGLDVLIVGSDGRGFRVEEWPTSAIFRCDRQTNLLVHDNVTRHYEAQSYEKKKRFSWASWGRYAFLGSSAASDTPA